MKVYGVWFGIGDAAVVWTGEWAVVWRSGGCGVIAGRQRSRV
jgi:hypothetical protein